MTGKSSLRIWVKSGVQSSSSSGRATHNCKPCRSWSEWRSSDVSRSEWTMPRPAVIQFKSPGVISSLLPRLSLCKMQPSNRYVTVARPICGWGGTSRPFPASKLTGPIWSKNTNGPTARQARCGKRRRTDIPSRSVSFPEMTTTIRRLLFVGVTR